MAGINIEELITNLDSVPLIDVRSPSEYHYAHIPGAISIPLFSDEERAVVGTAYKQADRQTAVMAGLEFFKSRMEEMVQEVAERFPIDQNPKLIVHCWRGGMRSGTVSWLLSLYGYEVILLDGGYKSFRRWALNQFEKGYRVKILGGYTGSKKTGILQLMDQRSVIDLENLANHRGSAFGAFATPQPSQEMFENKLALELYKKGQEEFWIEDESRRIGDVNLPNEIWDKIKNQPVYFIEVPFQMRLNNIVDEYGNESKEKLSNSISRIRKRLGPNETKMALHYLEQNDLKNCFAILLKYYDKFYSQSLNEKNAQIIRINCDGLEQEEIAQKLDNG